MRLKIFKKVTAIRIKGRHEYLLLMDLLDKAGYMWSETEKATQFNNDEFMYNTPCIIVEPDNRKIEIFPYKDGKPLRKVIKFEVGDKVKIKNKNTFTFVATDKAKFLGNVETIKFIYEGGIYELENEYLWERKWLEPVFDEYEQGQQTDWSKVDIDAPIEVSQDGEEWVNRHFAKIEDDKVYAWNDGFTSWTDNNVPVMWNYAKLADVQKE